MKAAAATATAAPTQAPDWQRNSALYLIGRSHLDGVDHLAIEMERKWGVDRLRLLVSADLRERFDRQRVKLNEAMRTGALPDVEREATRMVTAWRALDQAAEQAGVEPLNPQVWEVGLEDGTVAAIVRDNADAHAVAAQGRAVHVWTLEEIARIIHGFPALAKAKIVWPGAQVVSAGQSIRDPVKDLDDDLPF